MTTYVSRDPFARETIVKRKATKAECASGCAFCGCRAGVGPLYVYGVDPDRVVPRTSWDRKAFCSKGCRDAY